MKIHAIFTFSFAAVAAQQSVSDAFIYSLPAAEFVKTKLRLLIKVPKTYNSFAVNQPLLPNETFTAVVAPNVDTVYAAGLFDLRESPRLITVPPAKDSRYVVTDFIDPYGNSVFGFTTLENPNGGNYVLYGPATTDEEANEYAQVKNAKAIKFNTSDVLGLVRARHNSTDAQSAADFLSSYKAERLQFGIDEPRLLKLSTLLAQVALQGLSLQDILITPSKYSGSLQNSTIAWKWAFLGLKNVEPDSPASAQYVKTFESVIDEAKANSTFLTEIARQVPSIVKTIQAAALETGKQYGNGWSDTSDSIIGNFGENYLVRAAVAFSVYLALPPTMAIYYQTVKDATTGAPYSGSNEYQFTFKQLPPANGFWSITAYYGLGDPNYGFLIKNPIERFSIGDRTAGLIYNPDGSLTITVSAVQPANPSANWLPVGANRTFELFLRVYSPKPFISSFVPPAVEQK
ncbi:hypothetical protein HK103_007204 [Boothiomyces macroporosus]|uniref:DUF1254 domain-containing protein n=1 Tax=Boothiomyces macroporosus TaxID=261099 RepID=A0AAD5UFN1_9FUNG|nr:hypothetical protein HK103_007204 [Boothiomyces macroporosus]